MDYKKALIELINCVQLRRPGTFVSEDIGDDVLETKCGNIKSEMYAGGPEDPYSPSRCQQIASGEALSPKRFYYAICIAQSARGGGMTELFLDEHPLLWANKKREEMKSQGQVGVLVIQFLSEIPYEVYSTMKEQENKRIIEPPKKSLIVP